jgi:hypothetical protein
MTDILTPAEHYAEACKLLDLAGQVDLDGACPYGPGDCLLGPEAGFPCLHYTQAVDARDGLAEQAAAHARLAAVPEDVARAGAEGLALAADVEDWRDGEHKIGSAPELIHRIDTAMTAAAGPAWPAVDCGPAAAWSDLADAMIRALTGPYYPHWRDAHPGWPGGGQSAPGADDVVLVSAADLRTVVGAIVGDLVTDPAQDAATRLAGQIGLTS